MHAVPHEWVIKGLGMSSRVCVTVHIKDTVPLIENYFEAFGVRMGGGGTTPLPQIPGSAPVFDNDNTYYRPTCQSGTALLYLVVGGETVNYAEHWRRASIVRLLSHNYTMYTWLKVRR